MRHASTHTPHDTTEQNNNKWKIINCNCLNSAIAAINLAEKLSYCSLDCVCRTYSYLNRTNIAIVIVNTLPFDILFSTVFLYRLLFFYYNFVAFVTRLTNDEILLCCLDHEVELERHTQPTAAHHIKLPIEKYTYSTLHLWFASIHFDSLCCHLRLIFRWLPGHCYEH